LDYHRPFICSVFALCCLIDFYTGEDQAVILTGESGSGKTEAGKLVLQYIAAVTHHSAEFHNIKYQLLQSNPVLEGRKLFGAAQISPIENKTD
jgi:myosin-1